MKNDLSQKEIADRITDAILEERYINKESLNKIMLPILKLWLKNADSYKGKSTTPKHRLIKTIEQKSMEIDFWKNEVKKLVKDSDMKERYDNINRKVKEFNL